MHWYSCIYGFIELSNSFPSNPKTRLLDNDASDYVKVVPHLYEPGKSRAWKAEFIRGCGDDLKYLRTGLQSYIATPVQLAVSAS